MKRKGFKKEAEATIKQSEQGDAASTAADELVIAGNTNNE